MWHSTLSYSVFGQGENITRLGYGCNPKYPKSFDLSFKESEQCITNVNYDSVNSLEHKAARDEQMVQPLKFLSHKHEDWNLDPREAL